MVSLHDFDLRIRGIADVVDVWSSPDPAVRNIWKIDDLIGASIDIVQAANQVRGGVRVNGNHGNSASIGVVPYFSALLRRLKDAVSAIEARAAMLESQNHPVGKRADLREAAKLLQDILSEYERSAEAAEWDQLDREALTTQELLDIRQYLRESGQAST